MKKCVCIILLLVMLNFVFGQNDKNLAQEKDTTYRVTIGGSIFPNGRSAFDSFLQEGLQIDSTSANYLINKDYSYLVRVDSLGNTMDVIYRDDKDILGLKMADKLRSISQWNPTYVYLNKNNRLISYESLIFLYIVFDIEGVPFLRDYLPNIEND